MKKVIILVSIVAVVILMAGWTWFGGQLDHQGADVKYSSAPAWTQRASGSWAIHSDSTQAEAPAWTQRASGSWAFASDSVLVGSR